MERPQPLPCSSGSAGVLLLLLSLEPKVWVLNEPPRASALSRANLESLLRTAKHVGSLSGPELTFSSLNVS